MTTIYDAYGEDGDLQYMNGSIGSSVAINTSGNSFRSGFARCAIQITGGANTFMNRLWLTGGRTTIWTSARVWCNSGNSGGTPNVMWGLLDPSGVLRIAIENPCGNLYANATYNVYKVNAAGTFTSLGTTSSGFTLSPTTPDKLDCYCDYGTSGRLTLYINKSQVFDYSGDITTDSVTQIGGTRHSSFQPQAQNASAWSEIIVSDADTRDFSLATQAADAAGTLDQWTGAYTNVNETTVNDANFDTTSTSANVQRYKLSAASSGSYSVVAVITNLRATQGGGSLAHLKLAQYIGGTQYLSSQISFPVSLGPAQFIQPTNPATGAAWAISDLNASGYEAGYQALT